MSDPHLGELTELYALGMLDEVERNAADRHLLQCSACIVRLGQAEAAVASIVDATIEPVPAPVTLFDALERSAGRTSTPKVLARRAIVSRPPAARWLAAVAAICVLAVGLTALVRAELQSRAAVLADAVMLRALVDSHFNHAQFVSPGGSLIPAKVVYERHGRWFEILAHDIDPQTRVVAMSGGRQRVTGQVFAVHADMLVLLLPAIGPIDRLRLVDTRGRAIGQVKLTFAK